MFVPPARKSSTASRSSDSPAERIAPRDQRDTAPVNSAAGASWDFGRVAVSSQRPTTETIEEPIQIGATDDPLEQVAEAERPSRTDPSGSPVVGRANAGGSAGVAPPVVGHALRLQGQPLDPPTRESFGRRFGVDFADVRVHADPLAQRSAAAVHADAYTVGRHIVLGAAAPAPATADGRRLLGHELAHVVQQAHNPPVLQRQPTKTPTLPAFVPADVVKEIKRDNETWMLTVDGHTSPESLKRAMFRTIVPPGVEVTMKVAVTDPIERGWFVITGLTPTALQVAEPSFRQLFVDRGLVEDPPASDEMRKASLEFYKRHAGYSQQKMNNMAVALQRVTKRNPELLLAYYRYYAKHDLDDDSIRGYEPRKDLGRTNYGETIINPKVMDLSSGFKSSDPISLLGSTMIHEFVHTAHGGMENAVGAAIKEAKAYGIELFFAERMGDEKRADVITGIDWNSSLDTGTGANLVFSKSYRIMQALYRVIDQGGPAAVEARAMSVEFISTNESSYSPKLKAFIAKEG